MSKSKKIQYIDEIPFTISGIPCLIGVTHYLKVNGSHSYNAPSDMDYHGYTECDYDILDRKGYPAAWLERKGVDSDAADEAIDAYYS